MHTLRGNIVRNVKFGQHTIPFWVIVVLLISGIGIGGLTHHVWTILTVEVHVPSYGTVFFFEDFESTTLSSYWNIIDLDGGSTFNLTAKPGWLRITTTSPPWRELKGDSLNAPRIMHLGVSGDFDIETKVSATMDENDEGAGILVWKDSHSYLKLDRMCRSGNQQQILFAVEGGDYVAFTLASNPNPTYLKLTRSENSFSAYYGTNGTDWEHVGDLRFSIDDPVDIGLHVINAYHEGTFSADFDYFKP